MKWCTDVTPAAWIADRLHPFIKDVGSVIPEGYEAYARIFHPVTVREGVRERWTAIAKRNGRIAHPEMQFHMINRPVGEPAPTGYEPGDGPSWGSLPLQERLALVDVLRHGTRTLDRCWFCVWEGWGDVDAYGVSARVVLPHRDYLLATGPLELAISSFARSWEETPPSELIVLRKSGSRSASRASELRPLDRSANLWWPDDRAWFVATEIDYAWTYVGGPAELIERVLADDRLEALPARLTDKPFYESDLVNAALDG
jgi:hypothetical protein